MRKFRHLTPYDRCNIQSSLEEGKSIREIAGKVGVSPSTISREIRRNRLTKDPQVIGCTCKKLIKGKLITCNACQSKSCCYKEKHYYNMSYAQDLASARKHAHNAGPCVSPDVFAAIDAKLFELVVEKGQSVEAAWHACPDILGKVSAATIRRWIDDGHMQTKRANLRRARKYNNTKKYDYSKEKKSKGWNRKPMRTMQDYRLFMEEHPESRVLQVDSVEGLSTDKKAILTVLEKASHLQTGYLYSRAGASDTVYILLLQYCRKILDFMPKTSPLVIVTDNGTEFARISELEDSDGRIRVFFARPYCSTDKADCERNHEIYRYVYPKGNTLDSLSQKEVGSIFDNINSYARESLEWKSPCVAAAEAYGDGFLVSLGVTVLKPEDVNLRTIR